MAIRLRAALRGGVAAASAVVIALAALITPASDTSKPAIGTPAASHVAVELRDAVQSLPPGPALSALSSLSPAQVLDIGQALTSSAVTPTIAPSPPLINLANFIDWLYLAIEPWVEYTVDVAAYIAAWIIPYVGWIVTSQVDVVYNFVESLVHSGVFNFTDWLRGQGSALKNVADWVVDAGLALVWLGIDELGAWIPLPPLPFYPPRPPWADVPEGLFGDVLVSASNALAAVSNRIWDIWEPIKGIVASGVGSVSGVLDAIAWVPFVPLINFELNAGWTLIASEGDAVTGFAHDLINAGNQFVVDTVHGNGLITATVTALQTTLDSISTRGGQAIDALAAWGRAQLDYLVDLATPGAGGASALQRASATESSALAAVEQPTMVLDDVSSVNDGITTGPARELAGKRSTKADSPSTNTKRGAAGPDKDSQSPNAKSAPATDSAAADQKPGTHAGKPAHKKSADTNGTKKNPRPKDGRE
ncbi:hypothetical protein A5724_25530 [Mycobacterium sp. ACS1612]|nr:hypothetical protein A5724_25530 [Mycobacterium sp. ACS1612]